MTRYQAKPKPYRLVWDDGDLAGLVVTAKGLSLGSMLDLLPMVDAITGDKPDPANLGTVLQRFAACLLEWNLDGEDGQPVPPTFEGLAGLDPALAMEVMQAWTEAMVKVPPPLKQPSGNGQPEGLEASIPMMSQPSSSVPG